VVTLEQLVELGLSASAVRGRVASGRFHRVQRGVIALAPADLLTRRGRVMAAVLASSSGTVASHRTAGGLHELSLRSRPWVDVTSPGTTGRRRPGLRVHSGRTLARCDVTVIDSIPCTTFARTLLDVAVDATRRELERAIDRAEQLRILDMTAIDDMLARANGCHGTPLLRSVLDEHRAGSTFTRSELEERFLALCRRAALPPDGVNVWIPFPAPDGGGAEGDFVWRAQRLIVEVDGRDVHATRRAFETDRRRDQRLMLLGWRVVRFTWRQVVLESEYVTRTLVGLLVGAPSRR
jgi:hypothetical protein